MDIEDIDPRIRKLVSALNKRGCKTFSSCAGHKDKERGYAVIEGKRDKGRLKKLFGEFGIKISSIEYIPAETVVRFPKLGGSKGGRVIPELGVKITKRDEAIIFRLFSRNLHRLGIPILSKVHRLAGYALSYALRGRELKKEN